MRQAGVIAAAGIVGSRRWSSGSSTTTCARDSWPRVSQKIPGLRVDLGTVETNMVYVDHSDGTVFEPTESRRCWSATA